MGHILTDLKESFLRGNVAMQLIFINVAVFILGLLLGVFMQLFNLNPAGIMSVFALPASFSSFLLRPWSIVTYMFMHAGVLHILFNMLWLYAFGNLFLYSFSTKHLRGLYLLGGMGGGLLYMLSYNVFPFFSDAVNYSTLVGASASVLAIVAATAYRNPNYQVRLFLLGVVRLKYLAMVVIGMDLLFITSENGGGHIAHLGGAIAGICFAANLSKGRDFTAWINVILDGIVSIFSRFNHRPKMTIHYGSATERERDYEYNARKQARSEEVDRILDKLKKSGYESLTAEEKKSLFDASKR